MNIVDNLTGAAQDFLAHGRDTHTAAGTMKEAHAQIRLNLCKLRRQAWLTYVQLGRGQTDLTRFSNGNDVFQLAQCWTYYKLILYFIELTYI